VLVDIYSPHLPLSRNCAFSHPCTIPCIYGNAAITLLPKCVHFISFSKMAHSVSMYDNMTELKAKIDGIAKISLARISGSHSGEYTHTHPFKTSLIFIKEYMT
jgi:hypothetical protein